MTLQRGKDWGWGTGTDTAQAIVAMEMTKTGDRLERELSAKQLEIELLARLWQHHDPDSVTLQQQDDEDEALTVANIATYSMALAGACHDPRQFHGHDLIGIKSRLMSKCVFFFFFTNSFFINIIIQLMLYNNINFNIINDTLINFLVRISTCRL